MWRTSVTDDWGGGGWIGRRSGLRERGSLGLLRSRRLVGVGRIDGMGGDSFHLCVARPIVVIVDGRAETLVGNEAIGRLMRLLTQRTCVGLRCQ